MFENWSAGQLAVFATLLAAIVTATGASTAALINALAARRLAYNSARRDYRLTSITPYLQFLDTRIAFYHELMDEGAELSARLTKVVALLKPRSPEGKPL